MACNFQAESWVDKLREAGLDTALPSCFLWEGVTMYLPRQVVQQTLNRCRSFDRYILVSHSCSVAQEFSGAVVIAFDYWSQFMIEQHAEQLKAMGEPWLFGTDARGMEAMVEESGLSVLDNAAATHMAPLYGPVDADGVPIALVSSLPVFMLAGRL